MPTPKPEPPANADNPEQSRRFIDMAREVETDEGRPEAFEQAFEKIARRPKPHTAKDEPSSG